MTDAAMIERIKLLMGGTFDATEDARLAAFLDSAKSEILAWRFSYVAAANRPATFPADLEQTAVYAVIAGYSQSGNEAQTAGSENGISRTWKYESMVAWIHSNVVAVAGVL